MEPKVFTLTGSDEVTTSIALSGGISEASLPSAVKVADGNPGAMTYLVEIYKLIPESDFTLLCSYLIVKKWTGSKLYSFIKKHTLPVAVKQFKAELLICP